MGCLDLECLEQFLSDDLAPDERASASAHLDSCAACRSQLDEVRANQSVVADLGDLPAPPLPHDDLPEIPGYAIEREVHRGGQGIVYAATQVSTRRRVAIKLLLHGRLASEQQQRRFEREVTIAGSLRHASIVTIFDRGRCDDGRHYFVMELIDGRPLDVYAAEESLDRRARIDLFLRVARAVAFAHQHGVIHRDLKPANVLVDGHGEPRVLDFGLAKPAHAEPGQSVNTATGEFVGTLAYASPEQVTGGDTDTRADVYALGVILYELLTGSMPYRIDGPPLDVVRAIAETEPRRPEPSQRMDVDLVTILFESLSKAPERRYQSVSALVDDLERYLDGAPVQARSDSAWYLLTKAMKRNRALVAAALLAFVAVTAAAIVSGVSWRDAAANFKDAEAARTRAELDSLKLGEINDFLVGMLASSDPRLEGRDVTVVQILEFAVAEADAAVDQNPEVEAEIRATLGSTFYELGLLEEAEAQYMRHRALCEQTFGERHPATLRGRSWLALIATDRGRSDDVLDELRAIRDLQQEVLGPEHDDTLLTAETIGLAHRSLSDHDEAEAVLRACLETRRRVYGKTQRRAMVTAMNLALVLQSLQRLDEAEALLAETLQLQRDTLREDHPHTLATMGNIALLLMNRDRMVEAEPHLREILAAEERVLTRRHPTTIATIQNLAWVLVETDRAEEAEPLFREVLATLSDLAAPDDPRTMTTLGNLAITLRRLNRPEEAESIYAEVLAIQAEKLPPGHPDLLVTRNNLGFLYREQERYEEAAGIFAEIVRLAGQSLPADHWFTGAARANRGACLTELERYDEAETELVASWEGLRASLGPTHRRTLGTVRALIDLYERTGREEDARRMGAELPLEADAPTDASTP